MKRWAAGSGRSVCRLTFPRGGAYDILNMKGKHFLKSLGHPDPNDLQLVAHGCKFKPAEIRFEENWGKHAVVVIAADRFDCARFFPATHITAGTLAHGNGDGGGGAGSAE